MRFAAVFLLLLVVIGCGEDPAVAVDRPPTPYCTGVESWDSGFVAFEDEVLTLTNTVRANGADCGGHGTFAPTAALTLSTLLRCAARNQSRDMAMRDFFDHNNPDGETPFDRIDKTGYVWTAAGENIAAGQATPAEVVAAWMESDGHCANIMSPQFSELGVGYFYQDRDLYKYYWSQELGRPAS